MTLTDGASALALPASADAPTAPGRERFKSTAIWALRHSTSRPCLRTVCPCPVPSKTACMVRTYARNRSAYKSQTAAIDAAAEVCSIEPRSAAPPPVDLPPELEAAGKSSRTLATSEHKVRFERKQARQALTGSKMQGRLVRLVSGEPRSERQCWKEI